MSNAGLCPGGTSRQWPGASAPGLEFGHYRGLTPASERQRRGLIPALGNAPGQRCARIARAESPFHPPLTPHRPTDRRQCPRMKRAFSPFAPLRTRPGPSAQAGIRPRRWRCDEERKCPVRMHPWTPRRECRCWFYSLIPQRGKLRSCCRTPASVEMVLPFRSESRLNGEGPSLFLWPGQSSGWAKNSMPAFSATSAR